MVVAHAVAAASEISESHPNINLPDLYPQNINKLLTALNECTEWGQIFILDCLSNYNPKDDQEAQSICEQVTPRLSYPQPSSGAFSSKSPNEISRVATQGL